MGAVSVVMGDVLGQDSLEVSTPDDEHPVEALTADGPDEALGEGVGPGSSDRGADDADTFCLEDLIEDPSRSTPTCMGKAIHGGMRGPMRELEERVRSSGSILATTRSP